MGRKRQENMQDASLEDRTTLELPAYGSPEYKLKYRVGQVDDRGVRICGAKTRAGHPCRSTALGPAGRCRMHNGWALRGPAQPMYKHGRYSNLLPARLQGRYEEAMQDPELLNLKSEIALTDGRIGDLLNRVSSGESSKIWNDINSARKGYIDAAQRGDTDSAKAELEKLLKLSGRGHADFAIWGDINSQIKQRQSLVESERKRLVQMQQMVTAEQATVLINAIAHSIRSVVVEHCDRDTAGRVLTAIAADLARLLDRPDSAGAIAQAGKGLAGRVAAEE